MEVWEGEDEETEAEAEAPFACDVAMMPLLLPRRGADRGVRDHFLCCASRMPWGLPAELAALGRGAPGARAEAAGGRAETWMPTAYETETEKNLR